MSSNTVPSGVGETAIAKARWHIVAKTSGWGNSGGCRRRKGFGLSEHDSVIWRADRGSYTLLTDRSARALLTNCSARALLTNDCSRPLLADRWGKSSAGGFVRPMPAGSLPGIAGLIPDRPMAGLAFELARLGLMP